MKSVINSDCQHSSNWPQTFAAAQGLMWPVDVKQEVGEEEECKIEVEDHKYDSGLDEQNIKTSESCKYTMPSCESYPTSETKVFVCFRCSISSTQRAGFVQHMKRVHMNAMHKCSECEYVNKYRQNLTNHIMVKHDQNAESYKCTKCQYETKVKRYLKRHMKRRHNVENVLDNRRKCECKTKRKEPTVIHSSVKLRNVEPIIHRCSACDFTTKARNSLCDHLRAKHDANAQVCGCAECIYTTKERCLLTQGTITDVPPKVLTSAMKHVMDKEHQHGDSPPTLAVARDSTWPVDVKREVKEEEESKIVCEDHALCNHERELDESQADTGKSCRHTKPSKQSNPTSDARLFMCFRCSFSTTQRMNFAQHMRRVHTNATHKCSECGHVTKSRENLTLHVMVQHDKNPTLYQCARCDYKTKIKKYFNHHMRRTHKVGLSLEQRSVFKCACCEYTTASKDALKKHFTCKHDSHAEVFGCTRCSYATKYKRALKVHYKNRHNGTGEVFKCRDCDYTTKWEGKLKRHFRYRHEGNAEVFKCAECDYTTKWKSALSKHFRFKHDGQAEVFKCAECDFTTKYKLGLRTHHKYRHQSHIEVLRCGECEFTTKYELGLKMHYKCHKGSADVVK